jgi:uracil-DNA glycosylase
MSPPEGKKVTKTMIKQARPKILAKIDRKDPKYVVLLGNTPCQAVVDKTGITKIRGKPFEENGRSSSRSFTRTKHCTMRSGST